jgi:hypothetical protein
MSKIHIEEVLQLKQMIINDKKELEGSNISLQRDLYIKSQLNEKALNHIAQFTIVFNYVGRAFVRSFIMESLRRGSFLGTICEE